MSLLRDVVAVLQAEEIPHALIGAAALAVHGVSRATADVDLLTTDPRALRAPLWKGFETQGATVQLLKGDHDDPLAGNVRFSLAGNRTVDVVVGRHEWQHELIEGAPTLSIGDTTVKVVRPAGLVLLKLHAGGPRDAWDIRSLMESLEPAGTLEEEVDRMLPRLPAECQRLWKRLREEP